MNVSLKNCMFHTSMWLVHLSCPDIRFLKKNTIISRTQTGRQIYNETSIQKREAFWDMPPRAQGNVSLRSQELHFTHITVSALIQAV